MYTPAMNNSFSPIQSPLAKTLPIALACHAFVILGISFAPDYEPSVHTPPSLDITIVQTHSEQQPDKVQFLAQANQQASGSSDSHNRPTSPIAAIQPELTNGEAPIQSQESRLQTPPKLQPQLLTTKGETYNRVNKSPEQPEEDPTKPVEQEASDTTAEIAQLLAEMDEEEARYARRPRILHLDAVAAKSAVEAAYIDAWVKKIERVGNINFPMEAIHRNLNGNLVLNATLDRAGRVVDVEISVSSGYNILDQAAVRIVKLAAPYPPLPPQISEKWDQLNITRTWLFKSGGTLDTQ